MNACDGINHLICSSILRPITMTQHMDLVVGCAIDHLHVMVKATWTLGLRGCHVNVIIKRVT